jgi:hypothetical protein
MTYSTMISTVIRVAFVIQTRQGCIHNYKLIVNQTYQNKFLKYAIKYHYLLTR